MDWLGDLLGHGIGAAAGGVVGALLRFVPEVINLFKAKADRAHELAMRELDIRAAKQVGEQKLREIDAAGGWDVKRGEMSAWIEALKAQQTPTGFAKIDALNASVRPVVCYWFLALYTLVKVGLCVAALEMGAGTATALLALWKPEDSATLFGILGFYYVNREMGKNAR